MNKRRHQIIMAGSSVLVAVCVVITLVLARHPLDNQLRRWKLLPEPERLTELYFTTPNNLPSTYTADQTQTVAFTVHNLEYQTVTYEYLITEQSQSGGPTTILSTGNFTLLQNQYRSPAVKISLSDLGSRVKVEVTLVNVHESVDYWVNRSGT